MTKSTFTLPSPQTGTEYHLYVVKPSGRGPWTTVLFMDGDDQFSAAVKAYHALPRNVVPPLLLVGVGYGASYAKPQNRRGRDYTPVGHPDEPTSGGADAFHAFLVDTLWPELQARYPVDTHRRGIAGHSLGSLLVLHALFRKEPFFTHFLASAPSIWWANRAILKQAEKLRTHQATLPGKLFLSVGQRDSASMTGDLVLLENQLAKKPFHRLEVSSHRFPENDHYNVLPVAFATGFTALFGEEQRSGAKARK